MHVFKFLKRAVRKVDAKDADACPNELSQSGFVCRGGSQGCDDLGKTVTITWDIHKGKN